jgi:hypothetical protein
MLDLLNRSERKLTTMAIRFYLITHQLTTYMDHLDRFRTILGTIILASLFLSAACSKIDIDYSHDVVGTGTIMTDYRMGDQQTSEAIGVVRGTGDVTDKYFFYTNNNSSEIIVKDQFVLTKTAEKAVAMSVQPHLPSWPRGNGSYRLIGESWAKNIKIVSPRSSQTNSSLQATIISTPIPDA